MNPFHPRNAGVVLVTPTGEMIGALPAVPTATPYWQDIAPVVEAVRARYGVEVTILRLLTVADPSPSGVEITYLAETSQRPAAAEPWDGALDEHPLRLPYARPGGPAADLAWAEAVLVEEGLIRTGPPFQVRTWNLSSLWRLPVRDQSVWLKVVPRFFAHEGAVIEALAGGPVPSLLGRDGGRILMREIEGDDYYGAREPLLSRMVELLTRLQTDWLGKTEELFRLGLPDWRGPALTQAIGAVFERNAAELEPAERASLTKFVDALPERFADVAACGLPDTLVHGDFHPGNLRGDGETLTVLDWGDCGVGHPLLDEPAFLERIPAEAVASARARWRQAWRAAIPGSDPDRASTLLAPIAAVRQGVIYQNFLDNIEPSERPYHEGDPAERLRRTAVLLATESGR